MVVLARAYRRIPQLPALVLLAVKLTFDTNAAPLLGSPAYVLLTVFSPHLICVAVPVPTVTNPPHTNQFPAVKLTLVILLVTVVVKDTEPPATELSMSSATLPALAESLVVLPIIPDVELKVIDVADAAPSVGEINTGLDAKVKFPVPVLVVAAARMLALLKVPSAVATFAPNPEIPVDTGNPVQFVRVADAGIPKAGATITGELAKTSAPVPVSSDIRACKFALVAVAKKVDAPAAKPETPVLIGNPVQLVRVPDVGIPRAGVTKLAFVMFCVAIAIGPVIVPPESGK